MFKYLNDEDGNPVDVIVRVADGACIPKNYENSDYAEIMRQVEAGELTIQEADSE